MLRKMSMRLSKNDNLLQKVQLVIEIQQVNAKQKLNEQFLHNRLSHQLLVDKVNVVSRIGGVSAEVGNDNTLSATHHITRAVFTQPTMPPATGRHSRRGIMDQTSRRKD